MKQLTALLLALLAFSYGHTSAQIAPKLLPFQGRLTDYNGAIVTNGSRLIQFKIYDAPAGGQAVWNGEVQKLTVNGGLVTTMLGNKASLSGVDFNKSLYLELTIDANNDNQITVADPPLLPRQSILPAFFSQEAFDSRKLAGQDWSVLFGVNDPTAGPIMETKLPPGTSVPIGGVIMWWGALNQLPSGFELCNGGPPTTPDASLQRNKPDLRDRFVKGAPAAATNVAAAPVSGGASTIGVRSSGDTVLLPGQIPAHSHPVNITTSVAGNHLHYLPIVNNGNQGTFGVNAGDLAGYSGPHARTTDVQGNHTHSVVGETGAAGGGQPHNHSVPAHDNRPAFLELFFLIRVK